MKPITLLIVDPFDTESVVAQAISTLRGDWTVVEESHGLAALNRCIGHSPPNVILLEIELGDMDVLEFIYDLRLKHHREIPCVILSKGMDEEFRSDVRNFTPFLLEKPERIDKIVSTIERAASVPA
jgi:CheY-like chemotaxis protein